MSILAAVATFAGDEDPGLPALAQAMIAALPARAPDGRAVAAAPGAALGFGKLVVARVQGHAAQPLVDPVAGLTLVADLRLDNRAELRTRFDLPATSTDADILLAGYRRHGAEVVHLLIGDFAFVVWEARARRLFAARDPFGVRPLVYRQLADRLLVASDVEQILAVDPTAREVDEVMALDYLMYKKRFAHRTFFAPIKNVPAGHALSAAAPRAHASVSRWWRPAPAEPRISDEREGLEEFRRVFARAVSDRLVSDHPALVHVSGGFDSSVIALVAGQVGAPIALRAVGAVHPGLSCDETPFMDAVAARLPYPHEWWDGRTPSLVDLEAPAATGPGVRVPRWNGTTGDLAIARRDGARVILAGGGGDAFSPTLAVLRDCVRARRWDVALRATVLAEGQRLRGRVSLFSAGLRVLVPDGLRPIRRRISAPPAPPGWLAPARHWLLAASPGPPDDHVGSVGHIGASLVEVLTRPLSVESIAAQQWAMGETAIEGRFPFLDVRLGALVARLPLSLWRAPIYRRRLHALAYAELLPEPVRARRRKLLFPEAVVDLVSKARPLIEGLLRRSPHVQSFLAEEPAGLIERTYRSNQSQPADEAWEGASLLWKLATLEAWLKIV